MPRFLTDEVTKMIGAIGEPYTWPEPLDRSAIRRFWRSFLHVRITECASPLSASHSVSVVPGADREVLIAKIGAAVNSIARSERSSLIVVRDFLTTDRNDFDILLSDGFNLVSNMPLARIRVRWNSYDEYLSNMRSRYRKDVKRRLRRAARSGQEVRVLESFGGQSELWVEQARTVQENTKGFKREILPRGYYENMDAKLGDKSLLVAAERDGRIVAHGMVLYDDSDTIATYFGRDRGPAPAALASGALTPCGCVQRARGGSGSGL